MNLIQIIEPDILQAISEGKSFWRIINNKKAQQIYSKEILFQKCFNIEERDFKIFNDYFEEYKSLKHKCLNPLKYIIFPNKERMKEGTLCTEFQNNNLKDKVLNLSNENNKLKDSQKFIIIYGIAKFMEFLESNNKYHGRLNVNNIFLINKCWPIVTDPLIHQIFKKYEEEKKNLTFESLISYPIEYYKENVTNIKTDAYSYGILILQLFTEQIELIKFDNKLKEKILEGEKCNFDFNLQDDISSLINQCLQDKPSSRPDFKNIVDILEKIYQNNIEFKSEEYEKYKNYLNEEEKFEIIEKNIQIKQYKEDADKGDPLSMYLYGKAKYEGDKCDIDKDIGIKYLSSAAILKNKEAIYYFEVIEKERKLLYSKKDIEASLRR